MLILLPPPALMRKHQIFDSWPFHFEALRAMWYCPVGGSDYGEVMSIVPEIRDGDFNSWFQEWRKLAVRIADRADSFKDDVSRGKALLRSSNYMRTAEFFLTPEDPRRSEAQAFAQERFYAGLGTLQIQHTRSQVDYGNAKMETLFLPSSRQEAQDVLVVHGGFDSTLEELYFTICAAAVERGFHVLIFEGPGQGNLLRRYNLPLTHAWEKPAAAAIDSLSRHCQPRRIIGVGISLGGHLLARAAAFGKRYDGIVLFDYFPNPIEAFKLNLPRFLHSSFEAMPKWVAMLVTIAARIDPNLRWMIQHAKWVFGAVDLKSLVEKVLKCDDRQWLSRIDVPVFAMLGEQEHFFPKSLAYDFIHQINTPSKKLREFTKEEGGHLHCRNGAIHLAHEEIFEWIAEQFPTSVIEECPVVGSN